MLTKMKTISRLHSLVLGVRKSESTLDDELLKMPLLVIQKEMINIYKTINTYKIANFTTVENGNNCTYYHLHKFVGLIKKGESSSTNFVAEKGVDTSNHLLFPEYKCYDQLKDLLRKGKKDEAKSCIEKGFPLNKDCADDTYDSTPLHLAVSLEYPDIVELLLEKGSSVDSRNDSNETPLMLAAIVGNSRIINMILSKIKADNWSNDYGFSHFHIACMQNSVDLVQKFLISGVDVNKPVSKKSFFWSGLTPLHFAVEFRSIEAAKLLIENRADITIQDSRGLTPLHLASRKRNRLLTDLLLSKQYYYASNPVDPDGLSHFDIACAFNNREVVEDFLNKKIDVSHDLLHNESQAWYGYSSFKFAIDNQCINVLDYLLKCDASSIGRDEMSIIDHAYAKQDLKILHSIISHIEKEIVYACCSPSIVNLLNDEKINLCATDQSKSTLEKLCHLRRFSVSQYTELHVAVLQKNKDQVNSILDVHPPSIITVTDAQGKTLLHLAFETNQKDLVDQLLPLHVELDENPIDSNNFSHFHISCATKNVSIIEDFIKKGVDINMPINSDSLMWAGNTPLHLAIIHCRTKVVKLLLDSGADFTLKNAEGITPYDLAVPEFYEHLLVGNDDEYYSAWDSIELILVSNERRKFDNFEDQGFTLLHVASAKGDIDMIHRHARADTINKTVKNNLIQWFGFTSLHLAVFLGKMNVMKVLLDLGADPAIENDDKCTVGHYLCSNDIDDKIFLIPKIVYNDQAVSIFHAACQCGNLKGVQHFLKMGADVHERIPHGLDSKNNEDEGKSPLHLAVSSGNSAVVELLLEHGADLDARDCYYNTPLHFCTNKEVLKILLDHGADSQALNYQLFTALEWSIVFNDSEADFMTAVIESGWDINRGRLSLKNRFEPSNYNILARNIERLTVLGININRQNQYIYECIKSNDSTIRRTASSYKEECASELNLMNEIEIDSRTTLYDILFKTSSEMAKCSKNETLQEIFESQPVLREKYPIYAYLIILQIKKGIRRTTLLEQGKKSLSILMNRWMGDLVLEMILQLMNDHEITYLNYATSGQNIFH